MKYKRILSAAMAAVMAMSLAACGSSSSGASGDSQGASQSAGSETTQANASGGSADGKVTLNIAWWGNQIRNDVTKKAVDLYMSENPDVQINVEFSDWSGYWDKLSAMAAGGNLPDIIQQDYSYISQYQKSGQLADLTPFIEDGTIKTDKIPQSVIDSGSIDGKCYALSLGSTVPMMLYDKETVEKAGVTIPDQMTIDQLYDVCQTIYDKTGVYSLIDEGFPMFQMVARGLGSNIFDELAAGDTKSSLKEFQIVDRFGSADFYLPLDLLAEKGAPVVETRPIIDQTTWNDFSYSNLLNSFVTTSGREMGLSMYPLLDENAKNPMFLKPSMFFSIAETSAHKEAAAKFIDWFTNSKECNEILLAERGVPVNSDIADAIKPMVDATTQEVFDYVAKVSKVATPIDQPDPAGKAEIDQVRQEMLDQLHYKEITAEDAADQFAATSKQILADAAK